MSFSSRLFIYGPAGLLALLAALYGLYWKVSADMLSARLDRANGGEIMPGVLFAFAGKTVGGFPFRLDVALEGVTFAHQGPGGETAWRSEKIAIHALSYGKGQFVLEAAGLQSFAQPGANGRPPQVFIFTPAAARASAILIAGELTRFDLDLWEVDGKEATLGAAAERTFKAGRAQFHLLGNADKSISVALKIENAEIGSGYHAQIGPGIALINATGKIEQGQVFDLLRKGAKSPFAAMDAWRESHGKVEVESLVLHWNGAEVEAKGALVLAPDNQILGTFRGSMTGLKVFVQSITQEMSPLLQAQAVKWVEAMKEPVAVGVTLRNGEMRVVPDLLPRFIPGP